MKIRLFNFISDINECALKFVDCKNGKCVNTDGSYRCDCDKGYKKSADTKDCVGKLKLVLSLNLK